MIKTIVIMEFKNQEDLDYFNEQEEVLSIFPHLREDVVEEIEEVIEDVLDSY